MVPWRWKRTSLGALTGLVAGGALYQLVSEARDKSKIPVPGDLVDVDGHRLHIYGTGKGSPTVVMDSGYTGSCLDWSLVQPDVAKFTRVFTYDRAGLGWSDAGPKPRSSQRIVDELHRLLANAGVEGPYVMVGQSYGGMNVRLYASQHPRSVVAWCWSMQHMRTGRESSFERLGRLGYARTFASGCLDSIRSSPD